MTKKTETREETAQRIVGHHIDQLTYRSRLLRRALRNHADSLAPSAQAAIIEHLGHNQALTVAAIEEHNEIADFEFAPTLVDSRP